METLLYATNIGRILTEEDVNFLTPLEIESEGIHLVSEWNDWN